MIEIINMHKFFSSDKICAKLHPEVISENPVQSMEISFFQKSFQRNLLLLQPIHQILGSSPP